MTRERTETKHNPNPSNFCVAEKDESIQFSSLLFLVCVCLITLFPPLAEAQNEVARRDYYSPGLQLNTSGRTGDCDVFTFTRDGQYLLVAGDDKVVRNWKFHQGKLVESPLQTLRWKNWRDYRGQIHAMAFSPDKNQTHVVIGGTGMKNSQIAVIDRLKNKITHGLWKMVDGQQSSIWSIAYSPDGKQIAYGAGDGSIWIWDLDQKQARKLGEYDKGKGGRKLLYIRNVTYLQQNQLLSVAENGLVKLWNPENDNKKSLFQINTLGGYIWKAIITPNKNEKWLAVAVAAAKNNNFNAVILRSLPDGNQKKIIPLPKAGWVPRCLAFDQEGKRLAVGILRTNKKINQAMHPTIEIYSLKGKQPVLEQSFEYPFLVDGLAFHPKENYLAVTGGYDNEVSLWNLANGKAKRVSTIQGEGTGIYQIAFSEKDNKVMGFRRNVLINPQNPNERGKGPWNLFHLKKRRWVKLSTDNVGQNFPKGLKVLTAKLVFGNQANDAKGNKLPNAERFVWQEKQEPTTQFDAVKPVLKWGGWDVLTSDPKNPSSDQWVIRTPLGQNHVINLDRDRFGDPYCYSFLPPIANNPTLRLAVGHYYGVSIFELEKEKEPRRIRLMVGHEAPVWTLSISKDQKMMITGSRDQTICGWSLEPWPNGREFGAEIIQRGQKLIVNQVSSGSPAWEMGLSKDDEIVHVAVGDKDQKVGKERILYDRLNNLPAPKVKVFEQTLNNFKSLHPGVEVVLGWKRKVKNKTTGKVEDTILWQLSTIRQRPVWRFFPARSGEWIMWRWRDHYYATSTKGDSLIGFQENGPTVHETPKFHRAELFRKKLEKHNKLRELHNPEKLNKIIHSNKFEKFPDFAPPKNVRITPLSGKLKVDQTNVYYEVDKNGLKLNVHAEQRGPRDDFDSLDRALLWVNDYKFKEWLNINQTPFDREFTVPEKVLRNGMNEILFQCYNKGGIRGESFRIRIKKEETSKQKPALHGLLMGVGNYSQQLGNGNPQKVNNRAALARSLVQLDDLKADLDAMTLRWVLTRQTGTFFESVNIAPALTNKDVNQETVFNRITALKENVKPDDVLIVYLGGHGLKPSTLAEGIITRSKELDELPKERQAALKVPLIKKNLNVLGSQFSKLHGFYFCCSNFDPTQLGQTTIDFADLYAWLSQLNCHKIILLDTCHSGAYDQGVAQGLKSNHVIRSLTPDGVGPIILAGCKDDENAYEHGGVDRYMKSVFGAAIRTVIQDRFSLTDKDKNGVLNAQELYDGVQAYVQTKMKIIQQAAARAGEVGEYRQTPVLFLPKFEKHVPLLERAR